MPRGSGIGNGNMKDRGDAMSLSRPRVKVGVRRQHRRSIKDLCRAIGEDCARPHSPDFEVKDWKIPDVLKKWKKDNFDELGGGHPTALVLIGPSRYGKTEWAMSFGRPVDMTGWWDVKQVLKTDYTHVVLNGIHQDFRYKQEMATCQKVIRVRGKGTRAYTRDFDKPVIFTFHPDDKVLKDDKFLSYLIDSKAVFVNVSEKLF